MFSDQFIRDKPAQLHYRHHLGVEGRKQDAAKNFDSVATVPTILNFLSQSGTDNQNGHNITSGSVASSLHFIPDGKETCIKKSTVRDSSMMDQPLLQKRSSSHMMLMAKNKVQHSTSGFMHHSQSNRSSCIEELERLSVSDMGVRNTRSSDSMSSVYTKLKSHKRSRDSSTCRNDVKLPDPYRSNADLHIKGLNSLTDHLCNRRMPSTLKLVCFLC